MKNIVIWGTGKTAEKILQKMKSYGKKYQVVACIDNNREKIGTFFHGIPVNNLTAAKAQYEFECILIASVYHEEIIRQIQIENGGAYVTRWEELEETSYERAILEISSVCNAKCRWCVTGCQNREGVARPTVKFLNIERFKELHGQLIKKNIITEETELLLYNWGEPLLNPDFEIIVEYLHECGQRFTISTNASICKTFQSDNILSRLYELYFSMPGFSQSSYDRIHGFCLEDIKKNIRKIVENYRACGFDGRCILSFHIYQFNKDELKEAEEFAKELGIEIKPYYAYFNGLSMAFSYLDSTMPYEQLKCAGTELDLFYLKEHLKQREENYSCPQEFIVTLDVEGNIDLCCAGDNGNKGYCLGNIEKLNSVSQVKRIKKEALKQETCMKCKNLKADYWVNHGKSYNK